MLKKITTRLICVLSVTGITGFILSCLVLSGLLVLPPVVSATDVISTPAEPIPARERERARNYFTDTELITDKGKKVQFYSDVLEGHIIMINVMYTSCKGACPLITQKLSRVSQELGDLYGEQVHFVSLSNDPERDTPQALTKFAEKQGVNQRGWTFLTGKKDNINHVITKLGLYSADFEQHTSMILLGNTRTGHWKKVPPNTPYQSIVIKLQQLAGEG